MRTRALALLGVLIVAVAVAFGLNLVMGDDGSAPAPTTAPPSAARQEGAPAPGSDSLAADCVLPPELAELAGQVYEGPPPSSTPPPPPPDATPEADLLPPECRSLLRPSHDVTNPLFPSLVVNGVPIYFPDGTRLRDYRAITDQDPANPPPPIIELWVGQSWVKFNVQEGILLESDVKSQDAKALQPLLEALKTP